MKRVSAQNKLVSASECCKYLFTAYNQFAHIFSSDIPAHEHVTRIETRTERLARGASVGDASFYKSMGGLVNLSLSGTLDTHKPKNGQIEVFLYYQYSDIY